MILVHNIAPQFFILQNNQKEIAENVIKKVDGSGHWESKVVTEIKAFDKFFPAEEGSSKIYQKKTLWLLMSLQKKLQILSKIIYHYVLLN